MIYSTLHSYFPNISHFDLFRTSAHLCVFWNLLEVVPEHIFPPVRAAQAFIQCLQVHVLCLSDRCLVIFCFVLFSNLQNLEGAKLTLYCFPLANDDLEKRL